MSCPLTTEITGFTTEKFIQGAKQKEAAQAAPEMTTNAETEKKTHKKKPKKQTIKQNRGPQLYAFFLDIARHPRQLRTRRQVGGEHRKGAAYEGVQQQALGEEGGRLLETKAALLVSDFVLFVWEGGSAYVLLLVGCSWCLCVWVFFCWVLVIL